MVFEFAKRLLDAVTAPQNAEVFDRPIYGNRVATGRRAEVAASPERLPSLPPKPDMSEIGGRPQHSRSTKLTQAQRDELRSLYQQQAAEAFGALKRGDPSAADFAKELRQTRGGVGLLALARSVNGWAQIKDHDRYRFALATAQHDQNLTTHGGGATTGKVLVDGVEGRQVVGLANRGWGRDQSFSVFRRDRLPVSDLTAASDIGLPQVVGSLANHWFRDGGRFIGFGPYENSVLRGSRVIEDLQDLLKPHVSPEAVKHWERGKLDDAGVFLMSLYAYQLHNRLPEAAFFPLVRAGKQTVESLMQGREQGLGDHRLVPETVRDALARNFRAEARGERPRMSQRLDIAYG